MVTGLKFNHSTVADTNPPGARLTTATAETPTINPERVRCACAKHLSGAVERVQSRVLVDEVAGTDPVIAARDLVHAPRRDLTGDNGCPAATLRQVAGHLTVLCGQQRQEGGPQHILRVLLHSRRRRQQRHARLDQRIGRVQAKERCRRGVVVLRRIIRP